MVRKGHSYLNKSASKSCKFVCMVLLPLDIKGLSKKEVRIQLFDQNCKSELNLRVFFRIPPYFVHAYL